MCHFTPLSLPTLCIQVGVSQHNPGGVVPFGNLRIKGCLRLPEAYRSLTRPSSTSYAEASSARPYYLEQVYYDSLLIIAS